MNSNNAQITNLDLLDYMKENNLPILSKCLVNPLMDYILFSCKLIRSNLEETIILRLQKKIERFICTLHKKYRSSSYKETKLRQYEIPWM